MVETQVNLYQRSYRTFVKTLMCRAKAMVLRYNYGMWSHFSIVHNASIITYSLIITPEQCPDANKTGKMKITEYGDEIEVDINYGVRKVFYHNRGTSIEKDSPTSCVDRGQVKHYSFETLMQQSVLEVS